MPSLDITGCRFGKLTAVNFSHFEKRHTARSGPRHVWLCICDCGKEITARKENLRNGNTTSCGCRKYDGLDVTTHGYCTRGGDIEKRRLYVAWSMMLDRCRNTRNKTYKNYGGRGIRVCERWHAFENFVADMGHRPSVDHSIDRTNNNGNYEPGNCRWATRIEQRANQRRSMPGPATAAA